MPAQPRAFERPFRGGMVRDLVRAQQGMASAWTLEDAMFVNGIVEKRGAIRHSGNTTIDGSSSDIVYGVIPFEKTDGTVALCVTYYDASATAYYVALHSDATYGSGVGIDTATKAALPGPMYPVCVYQGEVILAPETTETGLSFRRYAGTGDDATAATGNVDVVSGSDNVVGTGTNFLSTISAGSYIGITKTTDTVWCRVVYVASNTSCRVSAPLDESFFSGSSTWTHAGTGKINLKSIVTEGGVVSSPPSTTVTGVGTSWNTGGIPGSSVVAADDIIGRTDSGESTIARRITVNGGNTSLTLAAAPDTAWADDNYRIVRHLTGRVAANHAGRLWAAGLHWDNDVIQVLPADYSMSAVYNGIDSTQTRAIYARTVDSFPLEGRTGMGQVVAMLSMPEPGPLVVLKETNAYLVYGEPPGTTVTKLGSQHGCLQGPNFVGSAACVTTEGAFWAGPDNVWHYTGGAPRPLMDGRIARYWRRLISTANLTAVVTVLNGCLWVTLHGSTSYTFVCDLESGAWSKWTGIEMDFAHTSSSVYGFGERESYYVDDDTRSQVRFLSTCIDGDTASGTVSGTFLMETGDNILAELGDYTRVTDMKIVYELYPATARVTVGFDTGAGFSTAATLAGVADDGTSPVQTTLVPLGGTVMGTKTRHLRLKLAETVAATRFRIHEVQFMVRGFKPET